MRAALGVALLCASLPATAFVYISELHYDNAGVDTGEFVEVTGSSGTDLSGWSLVLYNGNGGAPYATIALSGVVGDDGAGFGAASFDTPGLQNGSPDGVALVDDGGSVVQFLSYEGFFTAVGGPADGLGSLDIGISEPSDTSIGLSLQRTDDPATIVPATLGSVVGTWEGPRAQSPGAVNGSGQPPAPNVFINELHYDNAGTDTGEFVEVAGATGTNLAGWALVLYNGNGGAAYVTIALSGVIGDERAGFGALSFAAAGLQNGSPDGLALVDPTGDVVEFLSYEGAFVAVDGPAAGQTSTDLGVSEPGTTPIGLSLQRTGAPNALTGAAPWAGPLPESPGLLNPEAEPPTVKIHEIQGSGASVAITGPVKVEAVVTALLTRQDALDGFFIQEEDSDVDTDPATSEGIFVFCRASCPAVSEGNVVTVTGNAGEFFGMSQIDASGGRITVDAGSAVAVTPVAVDLPTTGSTTDESTFERLEGMIVEFTDTLVVSEYFQLDRFGQIVLTEDARPRQFTDAYLPGQAGYADFLAELARRRIILDDDTNDQNDAISNGPDEAYAYPEGGLSRTNFFRGGDSITGLAGVLDWSFSAWRVRPVGSRPYRFAVENARTDAPQDVGGSIKVASFNVLNYFATIEEPGAVCGPSLLECRGANSESEFERQTSKIVSALMRMDADVLGLIEIENDDGASASHLVGALNGVAGSGTWAAVQTGTIGTDAIKVAIIYKPASVTPRGPFAVLDSTVDPTFIDTKNRPALAQTFEDNATGAAFTVVVNHLKSKGSPCDDVGDPDLNDGQGNCNLTRTDAARALASWLATDPTRSGDPDVLIIGDLNAYAMEDPITALETSGYTNLLRRFQGPDAYTYLFDGQLGYLDHAFANAPLLDQIAGTTEWHINADEVPLLDYNDEIEDPGEQSFERRSAALPLYTPDAYRASDHDPILIGLELTPPDEDNDGVPDRDDVCPGTRIPEPITVLNPNHWALLGGTEFTQAPPQAGSSTRVTTSDTGGCSCEQIVAASGLGDGHLKFGCSNSAISDWLERN
jgi:predicted extracellular nuclease